MEINKALKLALQGGDENLDYLTSDEVFPTLLWNVLKTIAEHGRPKDMDKLIASPKVRYNFEIQQAIARQGRPQDLDVLMSPEIFNNLDWPIKVEIARHGRDCDLDVLLWDDSPYVRAAVASQGRDADLDYLVTETTEPIVLSAVARYGRDEDCEKLVKSPFKQVREAVARHGDERYRNQLISDKEPCVKRAIRETMQKQALEKRATTRMASEITSATDMMQTTLNKSDVGTKPTNQERE